MRYKKIIPAIPGTTVIHYNGYHDTTQEEPILFWGMGHEENDAIPYVMPFTFDTEGGQSTPFDLPEGGKDGNESCIVAFYIPGWGRLAAFNNSDDWGNFMSQVKGYDPDFGTNSRLETELTAVTEQRDRLAEDLNKMISICSCETEDIDTVNEIRYFVDTITKHSNP